MTTYHKSAKPLVWLPFAAGGVTAAMILPVMILITGILVPLGLFPADAFSYDRIHAFVANPLAKLILLGVFFPALWHGAHRFRCTLQDIGVSSEAGRKIVMWVCYLFGAVVSVILIISLLAFW